MGALMTDDTFRQTLYICHFITVMNTKRNQINAKTARNNHY